MRPSQQGRDEQPGDPSYRPREVAWWKQPAVRAFAVTVAGVVAPQLCAMTGNGANICNVAVKAVVIGLNGIAVQQERADVARHVAPCTVEFCRQFSGPGHGLMLPDAGHCLCPFP